jgi:hypothetical protein
VTAVSFDPASRYATVPVAQRSLPDGRVVSYVTQRFLPPAGTASNLTEVNAAVGERLDQLAARTIGDPGQYWRICDANEVLNPAAVDLGPGRLLLIPLADTFGGSL